MQVKVQGDMEGEREEVGEGEREGEREIFYRAFVECIP
jgi:hypothetical protein